MRRTALQAIALALVLLVAGCGGLFGAGSGPDGGTADGGTTTGTGPATDPDGGATTATNVTAGSTTAASAGAFPPGVGPSGVVEPIELSNAHGETLSGASYSLDSARTVRRLGNGSAGTGSDGSAVLSRWRSESRIVDERRYNLSYEVGGDAAAFLGGGSGAAAFYADGDRVARRTVTNGSVAYGIVGGPSGDTPVPAPGEAAFYGGDPASNDRLYAVFGAVNTDVVGTTVGEDGATLTRIRGSEVTGPDLLTQGANLTDPRNATLSATVGPDGLVRELRLAYDATWAGGEYDGEPVRVEWELAYDGYGSTTIDRPAWYGRAVDGDGSGDASGSGSDGTESTAASGSA